MRTLTRLAIIGGATTLALALAAPALAAYTPRLDVSVPNGLNAAGKVRLHLAVGPTDDATARIVTYSPVRFTVNAGAPGATIGTAVARVAARDLGGAIVPAPGTIEVRPASGSYLSNGVQVPLAAAATACTQTATHTAFWVFRLTVAGNAIELPAFFDVTAGAEQALGTSKVTFCGQPDDLPPGTSGRAPFGIKLVDAVLTLNAGVYTNPGSAGVYLWTSIWTPFNPGVGTANVAGTVSAISVTALPVLATLKGTYSKTKKSATLAGRVSIAGQFVAGVKLPLYAGPKATGLKRSGSTNATKASGAFTAIKKMVRTTYYQVRFAIPAVVEPDLCAAVPASLGLPRCVTSTVGGFSVISNILRVAFRR
jgi:hypothetical protein